LTIDAFPFSPSSFGLAENARIKEGIVSHLVVALEMGFIPVVYGDVAIDSKMGVSILSTEEVFKFVAERMKPSKVFIATDVDGVYDKDPKEFKDAKLIKVVDRNNIDDVLINTGSSAKRIDVTGGMKGKLSNLYEICKKTGATGYIFNAKKELAIKDMLLGRYKDGYTKIVYD
jgi:isopentenyl phosphate kinase